MNFFDHKDLGNHLLQLCPKVVKHPVYIEGKAVPLQAWSGPVGSRKLKLPDFVTMAQDGGRLSALHTGRLYPKEMLLVLISVKRLSRPQGHSAIGRILCQRKLSITPSGIEPETFLNHCATAVPTDIGYGW